MEQANKPLQIEKAKLALMMVKAPPYFGHRLPEI
jgi:hypothetical protein